MMQTGKNGKRNEAKEEGWGLGWEKRGEKWEEEHGFYYYLQIITKT